MGTVVDVYADVGRDAANISLRLARLAQQRGTQKDRLELQAVAQDLTALGEGRGDFQAHTVLLSSIEGQVVLVNALRECYRDAKIRDHLARLAKDIDEVAADGNESLHDKACELRRFFARAHNLAEEIMVIGLRRNPVVEVFTALA